MQPGTILAIDDDRQVRHAFRRILENAGFRVLEAEDGASGLARFRDDTPDAVLLDLRMPGLDGLDVLDILVAGSPETPVVIMSGTDQVRDVVEALRRGAWDYVTKPLEDSTLLSRAVARALERAELARQNREYRERLERALEEIRADERAARQLQFQLLPPDELRAGAYTCTRRIYPSRFLSGDFLEYFAIGDRFLGFYVADVAGHGAASALVTIMLTTLVGQYRDAHAARGDDTILRPCRLLARLDADLAAQRLDKHITMFYAVIDCASGDLAYGNAGAFPYPFLCDPPEVRQLDTAGRPLNLTGRAGFGEGVVRLEPGARLLVASDGVLELGAKGTNREKCRRLGEIVRQASGIDEIAAGLELADGAALRDDVALLLIERAGGT
jgi:sigma-B regulation protein RsbU (phosphoserine phosphatase)